MLKRLLGLLFLLPTFLFAQSLDKVVAVVNDGVITSSELNTQVNLLRRQMQAKKMAMPSDAVLKKQVLQRLIDVDLELQLAKQHNISIDKTELDEAIANIASENKITLAQLRQAVEQEGMSWKKYRENLQKEITMAHLRQKAVAKDVKVTPEQVEEYLKTYQDPNKANFTYHLQYIIVPLSEEPTSDEVKKAQEKAKLLLGKMSKSANFEEIATQESNSEFSLESGDLGPRHLAELPEIFAKNVIAVKTGQVFGPLRTGNGFQVLKLMAIGGDSSNHEVIKTHVRHILLKSASSMTKEDAVRQANNLYEQLKSGKDFAKMAKQYSLDSMSAAKGGDLGWISPGELVPPVEKAMNALPLHKVSKPIKSQFGWHLIEVLERKKVNDSASFKRQQVRMFLQQRKFADAVKNWQQHMRTLAYIKIMDKELA